MESTNSERALSPGKEKLSPTMTETESELRSAAATETETTPDFPATRIHGERIRHGSKKLQTAGDNGINATPVLRREALFSGEEEKGVGTIRTSEKKVSTVSDTDSAMDVSLRSSESVNSATVENTPRKSGQERRDGSAASFAADTAPAGEESNLDIQMVSARETRIEKRIQRAEHRTAETRLNTKLAVEAASTTGTTASSDSSVVYPATPGPAGETGSDTFSGDFRGLALSGGGDGESEGGDDLAAIRATLEKTAPVTETKRNSGQTTGIRHLHDASGFESGILNSVVRQARFMLQGGQSSATITLEPPSLGKMKLEIVTENSIITGKIMVESREVQDIIRNNMADLRQSLSQGGLQVESFDVQVGHNGGTDNWARREDMESMAEALRRGRENVDSAPAAPVASGLRGRSVSSGSGYIDMWM